MEIHPKTVKLTPETEKDARKQGNDPSADLLRNLTKQSLLEKIRGFQKKSGKSRKNKAISEKIRPNQEKIRGS